MYKILMILLLLSSSIFAEDNDESSYQLGDGVQINSLPLYIGGYISSDYKKENNTNQYRVDDIAMLAYGDYEKLSYMAEVEFKEFYTIIDTPHSRTIKKDRRVHIERLYLDYNVNDNVLVKVGKYNTPIGYWNLLPVNVLRDTTSSPISNSILYPTFSTGANVVYNLYLGKGRELTVDAIVQKNNDVDSTYNNYITDEHYGLGMTYEKDDLSFKINAGVFHDILDQREKRYYFLFSSRYETDDYQFTTEIGSQTSTDGIKVNYAGYSQLAYHLTEKNMAILRLESYDNAKRSKQGFKSDDIAIIGYTYRPLYPIAIKAEYQFKSKSKDDTFLFSLSVMF